jgi:hypothetical protein
MIYHLLGLHMHQPMSNLRELPEDEVRQILFCYDRPLKYAYRYKDVARFAVCFSGSLLEQLTDPVVVQRYHGILHIEEMLESYSKAENIEIVGTGYYHPLLPIIPDWDWDEQIARGRKIIVEVFGKEPEIFWPPESGFDETMVPKLVRNGYKYVIADHTLLEPAEGKLSQPELKYRLHRVEYGGESITVVPRDCDLSKAQLDGTDRDRFKSHVPTLVRGLDNPLVTTWTDGENGEWFRRGDESQGFWGRYFAPYMDSVKDGTMGVCPVSLREYPGARATLADLAVKEGAYRIDYKGGPHWDMYTVLGPRQRRGLDSFLGTKAQMSALGELFNVSMDLYRQRKTPFAKTEQFRLAQEHVLKAEASDFFFWGDAWLPRCFEEVRRAREYLP